MCPTIAASPAAAGSAEPAPMRPASQTLAAPFAMSSAATSRPAATPDARMTFAAPRLPLPTSRTSDPPQRRARISANGIDPRRYAATIAKAITFGMVRLKPDATYYLRARTLRARGVRLQADPVRVARAREV